MAGSTQPENLPEQSAPLRIVALAITDELEARLRTALPEHAELRVSRTLRRLGALVMATQPSVILLEVMDGQGERLAPSARWLRETFPSTPIVACCALSGATAHDILILAKSGVTDLALRGFDDIAGIIASAVRATSIESLASRVMRELGPVVPRRVRPVVEYCLANAKASVTVDDIAAALGMPRKTLARQLAQAGMPSPKRLVAWGRVFIAAQMMQDQARSIDRIAHDLEFPSTAALRKLLRRLTGFSPQDVRECGGLDCVQAIFRHALLQGRRGSRSEAA